MPLQKNASVRGGYTADYHKITRVHFDVLGATGYCDVSVYKDKAAYDAGEASVTDMRLEIPPSDFVTLADIANPAGLYQTMSSTLYAYFRDAHTDEEGELGALRGATLID